MMPTRIALLEKFGVWTVTMSYFGSTHWSFLLLTQLSRNSRHMLNDNYQAFLNSMIRNNQLLRIEEDETILNLPWDLFKYWSWFNKENKVDIFIKLVVNINDMNGSYFNEHFMNSRLWIEAIWIEADLIRNLYPYIEIIKKTEAIDAIVNWDLIKIIFEYVIK